MAEPATPPRRILLRWQTVTTHTTVVTLADLAGLTGDKPEQIDLPDALLKILGGLPEAIAELEGNPRVQRDVKSRDVLDVTTLQDGAPACL